MKEGKLGFWRPMVLASATILALTILYWWALRFEPVVPDSVGVFGDAFGALNTLFAGLAFAGVIVTLMLQQQELRLQREEIRESRKAQQGAHMALDQQALLLAFTGYLQTSSSLGAAGDSQARAAVAEIHEDLVALICELTNSRDKGRRIHLEVATHAIAVEKERQRVQATLDEVAERLRGQEIVAFFEALRGRNIVAHVAFQQRTIKRNEKVRYLGDPTYETISDADETILDYRFNAGSVSGTLAELEERHGILPFDSSQDRKIAEWQEEIGDR